MTIRASVTINRPIQAIFDCMTSTSFLQWLISAFSAKADTLPPELHQVSEVAMGVGTKFIQGNTSVNHSVDAAIEVIGYKPPMVLAFEMTIGPDVSIVKWNLRSTFAGTMVMLLVRPNQQNRLVRIVESTAYLVAPRSRTVPPQYAQGLAQFIEKHCW